MRSLAWVSALILSVAALRACATPAAAAAVVCPTTGEPAPDVITVMATKAAPATDAWIIKPDCSVETVSVLYKTIFQLENKNIEHVISIPSDATYVAFFNSPLSRGADFSAATKADSVVLNKFDAALLGKLVLPSTITTLFLDESPYKSLDDFVFPPVLQNLAVRGNLIKSFKNVKFPSGLKQLYMGDNMTAIDFAIPSKLSMFFVTGPFPTIERVKFPDTITDLGFSNTSVVRGITWPAKMKNLYIDANSFTSFEIRQSDVELFSNVFRGYGPTTFTTACADPTGVLTTLNSMTVCVISDERFETLYGDKLVPLPTVSTASPSPTDGSEGNAGSGTSSDDPTDDSTTPASSDTTNSQIGSTEVGEDGETTTSTGAKSTRKPSSTKSSSTKTTQSSGSSAEGAEDANASTSPGTASKTKKPTRKSNSTGASLQSSDDDTATSGTRGQTTEYVHVSKSMSTPMVIAVIVVGVALALLIAGLVFRLTAAKKVRLGKGDDSDDDYATLDTPSSGSNMFVSSDASTGSGGLSRKNDVRYDPLLLPFRIKNKDILVGKQIGSGSIGIIYRGKHKGVEVAVKRIHAGLSSDKRVVNSFMDEIRVCASVDHPKIVAFVGMAWSGERDLSVITELMAGGDLQTVLYTQNDAASPRDWSSQWSSKQLKNKTAIALDVAEALAYLHSFSYPILSRDLRARNVLLDVAGNAKLSASGIGHDASVDETMRSAVNTTAWTSPEVLFGEPCTMQSDIYALGVLLVELDRCCHPFAHDQALFSSVSVSELNINVNGTDSDENATNEIAHKNIQIAVLVSTGQLRPSVTSECPPRVAALATKCLSFEPAQRPTAQQVLDELRDIVEKFT